MIRRYDHKSAIGGTIASGILLGMAASRVVVKVNNMMEFETQGILVGGAIGLAVSALAAVCFWMKYKKTPEGKLRTKLLIASAVAIFVMLAATAMLLAEYPNF